mmetsp:Transcript_5983/g.6873  ORF Transcript_5983/g.6873 Transcript_5983/m.6873 type:complete len:148 (+) Transcript_5983:336-779(+)
MAQRRMLKTTIITNTKQSIETKETTSNDMEDFMVETVSEEEEIAAIHCNKEPKSKSSRSNSSNTVKQPLKYKNQKIENTTSTYSHIHNNNITSPIIIDNSPPTIEKQSPLLQFYRRLDQVMTEKRSAGLDKYLRHNTNISTKHRMAI